MSTQACTHTDHMGHKCTHTHRPWVINRCHAARWSEAGAACCGAGACSGQRRALTWPAQSLEISSAGACIGQRRALHWVAQSICIGQRRALHWVAQSLCIGQHRAFALGSTEPCIGQRRARVRREQAQHSGPANCAGSGKHGVARTDS